MSYKIIDLSYGIFPEMSKYPSDPAPQIEVTPASLVGEKYSSAVSNLILRPHHGTHIDAPAHKIPGGKTIDQYSVEKFINLAYLIDLTEKKDSFLGEPVREINPSVIEEYFTPAVRTKLLSEKVTALLFRTGYDQRIIQGTNNQPEFSYFTEGAAELLANSGLPLNIVGIDSFAFDKKGSNSEAHRQFLSRDILLLESLVNLDQLKDMVGSSTFLLHSVPILYQKVDAAQTRAYALFTELGGKNGSDNS